MALKRSIIKERKRYYGDFDGPLPQIISGLQAEVEAGWEGLESEYERDYGECCDREVYYLYKHRPETDAEYEKRARHSEKAKEKAKRDKEHAQAQKLKNLKLQLASLTDKEKEELGIE